MCTLKGVTFTLKAGYSCCCIWHTDAVPCIQCALYNQCTDMSTDSVSWYNISGAPHCHDFIVLNIQL